MDVHEDVWAFRLQDAFADVHASWFQAVGWVLIDPVPPAHQIQLYYAPAKIAELFYQLYTEKKETDLTY